MALQVQQVKKDKTWTALLIEESENSLKRRKASRERTFRRMYSSVFVLMGAVLVTYCSLFYIGAFIDVGKVVGISQSARAEQAQQNVINMPRAKNRTLFSPILEHFYTNRIYMRKGQSILATYSLPSRANLSLKITQCKSLPIIEVFKCEPVSQKKTAVRNKTTGYVEFTVSAPGFYYFESEVIKAPNKKLASFVDYRVIWQRGSGQAVRARPLAQLR